MTAPAEILGAGRRAQRGFLLRFLLVFTALSLIWEFAQMPFYTIAETGTRREITYAALHCTPGDAVIGGIALLAALTTTGAGGWPRERRLSVLAISVLIGLGYAIFSEWLNVEVRGARAYSERMPHVPGTGTGLAPLLQWASLPVFAYLAATSIGRTGGVVKPSML